MRPKKAIIFDLGNVLISIDNPKGVHEFLPYIEAKKGASEIERILYPSSTETKDSWSNSLLRDFHTGKLSSHKFYDHVKKELNFSSEMTFDLFQMLWPDRFSLRVDMMQLLPKLKVSYRFILSDTNPLDADWLLEHFPNLFTQFDHTFFSHNVGIDKYSHQAWHNVMAVSKLPPDHHVFVDDRPDHVSRAKELGIHGIVYTDTKILIHEFTSEGIL
jgi:HAD superfamily hydrolase (TIGR01509 family)